MSTYTSIANYADVHYQCLKRILLLPDAPPSHDTIRRIIQAINPEAFKKCFIAFTQHLKKAVSEHIAIDEKTIRNSGNNPLQIVSAWCEQNELMLAQQKVGKNSNEIKAIPTLLELLELTGKTITIDAIGCQRTISEKIINSQGDYILSVKQNHPTLYKDIVAHFNQLSTSSISSFTGDVWHTCDKGHSRIEERTCYAVENCDSLKSHHSWPGLQTIIKQVSKRTKGGKTTEETRYHISSLPADTAKMTRSIRNHWAIENKLHWRLDVNLNEDKNCISDEHGAENMSMLRKLGLNIVLPHRGKSSDAATQRKAAMSWDFMLKLLRKAL